MMPAVAAAVAKDNNGERIFGERRRRGEEVGDGAPNPITEMGLGAKREESEGEKGGPAEREESEGGGARARVIFGTMPKKPGSALS
ncbi:hypothetical protein NL676_024072 [Syzygium grande]|nr:hypothetical protein NL676_024072 [Syzygium grande]